MSKPVHLPRLDSELNHSDTGRFFFDGDQFADLSNFTVLHCAVDTVRQLYRGFVKPELLEKIENASGFFSFGGYEWVAGRIGRDSGYQFKLQNADLGLVLLIKNFNVKSHIHGPHLKIEVSPHLIDEVPPKQLQSMLDTLASQALDDLDYNQSAVHIAVDVQGWTPPADTVARMHCRSRAVRQFDGVDTIDFAGLSCTYGRGQTYMFGSASGLQLCIYNKTLQAKSTDKLDFWEDVWRRSDNPFEPDYPSNYDPQKPVWRIEFRYHHSVVQQFSDGILVLGEPAPFHNFLELSKHLDGLLHYGLDAFRLLHRPGIYHPAWSVLFSDARVSTSRDSFLDKTEYKRYYKTSTGFTGKNIELLLGNAISLAARERLTAGQTLNALKSLPFWSTIKDFYADKGKDEKQLKEHIANLLKERYIRWGKAV